MRSPAGVVMSMASALPTSKKSTHRFSAAAQPDSASSAARSSNASFFNRLASLLSYSPNKAAEPVRNRSETAAYVYQ